MFIFSILIEGYEGLVQFQKIDHQIGNWRESCWCWVVLRLNIYCITFVVWFEGVISDLQVIWFIVIRNLGGSFGHFGFWVFFSLLSANQPEDCCVLGNTCDGFGLTWFRKFGLTRHIDSPEQNEKSTDEKEIRNRNDNNLNNFPLSVRVKVSNCVKVWTWKRRAPTNSIKLSWNQK